MVQIYVDDIICGSTNESLCKYFSSIMQGNFENLMMGYLSYFLVLQIKQTETNMFISQKKYCLELLKKYDMKDSKRISTSMTSNLLIDKDEQGMGIIISKYIGIIESLLYLTASSKNIMFNVCMCTRFQV